MLDRVAGDIAAARALPTLPPWQAPRECGEDDPAAFTDGVTRILDYLAAGDVFQANLSRGWCARFDDALDPARLHERSEEHTSELQSLMRISYAVFCLKKKTRKLQRRGHSN